MRRRKEAKKESSKALTISDAMHVIQQRPSLMYNILKGPKIIATVQNIRGYIVTSKKTTILGSKKHP